MTTNPKRLADAGQFEVMRSWDNNVLTAGLPSRPESQHMDPRMASTRLTEAVVTAVYYPDEETRETHKNRVWVTADVRTIPDSRPLYKVPVFQFGMGLHDEDLWIPRASRLDLDGGTLQGEPTMRPGAKSTKDSKPTNADATDGDRVLIAFLNGSPGNPIILPLTKGHPKAGSGLKSSGGRIRRIRHHGTSIAWDSSGNLTIDASAAAAENLGTGGAETVTGTSVVTIKADSQAQLVLTQGSKKVEVTAGTNFEVTAGTQAKLSAPLVQLSDGPAFEPVLKGTSYIAAETALYGVLTAYMAATQPVWEALAQVGAPGPLKVAEAAGKAAAAWSAAAGLPAWLASSALSKSLKVTTG